MMTNASKIAHVVDFVLMVEEAKTYESAQSHATYTKGLVSAWHLDGSIGTDFYRKVWDDLEIIMTDKRKLS